MKKIITYIIGLFFGILISALLILYLSEIKKIFNVENTEEHFKDNDNYEKIEDDDKLNILSIEDLKNKYDNEDYIIHNKNTNDKIDINNFMINPYLIYLISSYEHKNTQENIEGLKWKIDNNSKYINDIIVSGIPLKSRYILNPNIYGYNLNNISIEINNNYNRHIDSIGILFTMKFNNITNSNLLLVNENKYDNIISINIEHSKNQNRIRCNEHINNINNINKNPINIANNYGIITTYDDYTLNHKQVYDMHILINMHMYHIYNISEDILKEPSVFIGLIINKTTIYFYINDEKYDFKRLDKGNIIIDYPFYINKNKDFDITIYSNALIINDINIKNSIEKYKLYNNYNFYNKMNI